MKSYDECLAWMQAVEGYRLCAPEGIRAVVARPDTFPTLRDVDPKAITQLAQEFEVATFAFPSSEGTKWKVQLDGSEDGEYYKVTILQQGLPAKLSQCAFSFFYRKQSGRTRREAYDYAF